MKAKELAEILLQNPEFEVKICGAIYLNQEEWILPRHYTGYEVHVLYGGSRPIIEIDCY